MSGGVDSSLAAALLKEQGYEVIGVMMRLWAEVSTGVGSSNKCCSIEAVSDARRVADLLDIPFYLINVEQPFKARVVDFTVDRYLAGETPNPCIQCNRHIRFDYLYNYAMSLGANYLATGHYARVRQQVSGIDKSARSDHVLLMGVDQEKDQSYVLHVLTQQHLAHVLFPVGDLAKPVVRQMAAERGLPVAGRHDSQDLCFLADGDYRRFLRDSGAAGRDCAWRDREQRRHRLGRASGPAFLHHRTAQGTWRHSERAVVRAAAGGSQEHGRGWPGPGARQRSPDRSRRQLDRRTASGSPDRGPGQNPLQGPARAGNGLAPCRQPGRGALQLAPCAT